MTGGLTRRGQPLLALVLLMGAWVSARAVMWEPGPAPDLSRLAARPAAGAAGLPGGDERPMAPARQSRGDLSLARAALSTTAPAGFRAGAPGPGAVDEQPASLVRIAVPRAPAPAPVRRIALPPQPVYAQVPATAAVGHQLLLMAALARVPLPSSLSALPVDPQMVQSRARPVAGVQASRWSADGWILWRRGSVGAAGGLLTPSYGASQAGAVIRYRLAPSSALRPAAYLRATAALNGSSEREAAFGLQVRPLSGLPVALLGEGRVTAVPGRTYIRPAVLAVTELAPADLPLGLRGELYAQGGYVGGRNATGFADGQVRVDGRMVRIGKGDLRLGGGVWGGVQKGASRLDAGPTVTFGQPLGGSGSMRLAADWRFRVAGGAAPGSGPAVTLSAGF